MTLPVIALRSADTETVDAVRAVVALAELPLAVYPPGSPVPDLADVVLDSAAEATADDPSWTGVGRRFAWVGVRGGARAPDDGRCLVLPDAAEEVLARIRAAGSARRARVVGVLGARGGAGASCLAAALSRTCADRGLVAGLVDLDAARGGIDVLIGIEHEPGLRWADVASEPAGFDAVELLARLPAWRGVRVLSADVRGRGDGDGEAALAAVASQVDAMVVDLPRTAVEDGTAARWCDVVVVVAGCDVQSVAGAQACSRALAGQDVRLVVRGPAPGGLTAEEVADASRLPLLAHMPPERSLAAALERGVAPGDRRRGPLARTARRLMTELDLDP